MIYWRIQFDDREFHDLLGWLEINSLNQTNRVLSDDGTPIEGGISYTTIDTNPAPPPWSIA